MEAGEKELKAWVRERLAVFKTPVRILFIDEPLPRNANGKIMKKELKKFFEADMDLPLARPNQHGPPPV